MLDAVIAYENGEWDDALHAAARRRCRRRRAADGVHDGAALGSGHLAKRDYRAAPCLMNVPRFSSSNAS